MSDAQESQPLLGEAPPQEAAQEGAAADSMEFVDELPPEIANGTVDDINMTVRMLNNDIMVLRSELGRLRHEVKEQTLRVNDNTEKIRQNKQLPYLVSNVVEILDIEDKSDQDEGANVDLDSTRVGKCVVIKTTTRQTIFLPLVGLVDPKDLKPRDLVGVQKDSYLILDTLPSEYDSRVKAMEVDEKPTEQYTDIGGLSKQIEELIEAIVLPMKHADRFKHIGIKPPKGALMYGPPGKNFFHSRIIIFSTFSSMYIFVCLYLKVLEKLY